jgi:sulfatase maturation enzyme AslB (radical SAM superfamily)
MPCKSKTFCMHPFTGLATREDGAIKICCRSAPIGDIKDNTLEEIWNGDKMKEVRRQVMNDERPNVCEPCFRLEDQGVQSLRQRHTAGVIPEARINLYPDALDALNEDYTMPFELPTMEIKLNNLCNLKCRMCNPLDSTQWKDWNQVTEFYKKENNYLIPTVEKLVDTPGKYIGPFDNSDNWWSSFEKLLPFFRRVEFAGGEPLMDPYHYKILDRLAEYGENIEIKYATNGTTLGIKGGRTIHDYWPKFKSVAVNISIDGLHDTYEYIRGNGKFSEVEENVKVFKSFPNVSRVVGAFTVQANNIMQICDVIDYFLNDMGIIFYSHRVNYPMSLSAQVVPPELKEKVIKDLEAMKTKVLNYDAIKENELLKKVTLQQIQDNINFLQAKCMHDTHWQDCIAFNHNLDKTRGQDFLTANPEFAPYV